MPAISGTGCVTVADFVLVDPPGATIDGNRVHLVPPADAVIRERIEASGGPVVVASLPEASRPLGYERCEATEVAVVSTP